MDLILRAFINPALDQIHLRGVRWRGGIRRWHARGRLLRRNSLVQTTLGRIAGHDDLVGFSILESTLGGIKAQFGAALRSSGPWQAKQLSERMGRISRSKLIEEFAA